MDPVRLFTIYASDDVDHCKTLDKHLVLMRRAGIVTPAYNPADGTGAALDEVLEQRLEAAQILLVLVTANLFLDESANARVDRALERAKARNARVIPIMVGPVNLADSDLKIYGPLPRNGKPITRAADPAEAWTEVAAGVRDVAKLLQAESAESSGLQPAAPKPPSASRILRDLINNMIKSDSDLEQFCLDYFDKVQKRFTNGMDRVQKVNLLLTYGTPEAIRSALAQSDPEGYAQLAQGDAAAQAQSKAPDARTVGDPTDDPDRRLGARTINPTRNRYALLIGVNNYVDDQYFPPLRYCVNDVRSLEKAYERLGYTVVALHDDAALPRLRPTLDNVEAELANLAKIAGPDDLVLVHFSGHGKLIGDQPVLITQEMRNATLEKRALRVSEVKTLLNSSKARRRVLFLDSCHGGIGTGRGVRDPAYVQRVYELAEGFAMVAASTSEQQAFNRDEVQLGAFTSFLLEALEGRADEEKKGFVTVDDIKKYTLGKLGAWGFKNNIVQEPTADQQMLGDMIIADYRKAQSAT